jgi:hypothetical protein
MEENKIKKNPKPTEQQLVIIDMLKVFYERPSGLKDDNGNPFPIPYDGSLGLLAIGHVGLIEWRKKREMHFREKTKLTEDLKISSEKEL